MPIQPTTADSCRPSDTDWPRVRRDHLYCRVASSARHL